MDWYDESCKHLSDCWEDGYKDCLRDVTKQLWYNMYKFGVDTSDTNQVYDFWDKLGFDPYTLEPK